MSGEVFGFEESAQEFDVFADKATQAKSAMEDVGEKMKETAKQIASSKGLNKTGAGISGIVKTTQGDDVVIGWATRPNLHLYFHELGFHALDNRRGRRKKRQKGFRGKRATYVPPSPHMRPAFYKHEREFVEQVQNKIT